MLIDSGCPDSFPTFATYRYTPRERARFLSGSLIDEWAADYPDLFYPQDVSNARAQTQRKMRYHFVEWFASVMLFRTTGHLSLLKYEFPSASAEKLALVRRLLPDHAEWLLARQTRRVTQCPDLLLHDNDRALFFLEVKGPTDTLRTPQREFFRELHEAAHRVLVVLVRFHVVTLVLNRLHKRIAVGVDRSLGDQVPLIARSVRQRLIKPGHQAFRNCMRQELQE